MILIPLTLVLGWRGSGKTLFCVIVNKLLSTRPIYSNFKIIDDRYKKFNLVNLLDLPNHVELIMDEGYSIIDSRISMSYVNMFAGYIAFQLRKTDTNIFITAQQKGSIDLRYREEYDYLVECDRSPNESEDWHLWDFSYTISDIRKQSITTWIVPYIIAENYFNFFDTNEIIQPRNKSRIEYELLKDDPERLMKRAIKISYEIKDNVKKITKDVIEIALLRHKHDPIWTKICYLIFKNYLDLKNN